MNRSLDSGNETMRTDATHSDVHNNVHHVMKRVEPINVLAGIKEVESDQLPSYLKHPPSPPVRLKSRYVITVFNY